MSIIDAAIVGLGRWGKNLTEAIQNRSERVRFVRGVDAAPEKVREFAARHDLPLTTDFAGVLADPAIRAVVVVTPHSLHRPMVEAAPHLKSKIQVVRSDSAVVGRVAEQATLAERLHALLRGDSGGVVLLERLRVVALLVAERLTEFFDAAAIRDQPVPIVVTDLVAKVAEQRAESLAEALPALRAHRGIRFRKIDRDDTVCMPGRHRL